MNQEARIDSLPQSWAVISERCRDDRARRAMESAERHLVDERDRLVRLFTPPFDHSTPNPGYIMGYPPGLRENGGQYTHGSLWMAMARARMGDGNAAVHLLKMMNPVELTRARKMSRAIGANPTSWRPTFRSAEGKIGRSGWTWYTGSAGWMYRIWIEEVLGFQLRGDVLTLKPVIPDDWPGFEMTYRYRSSTYEIAVLRHERSSPTTLELDGQLVDDSFVRLADDGITHHLTVRIASRSEGAIIEEPVRHGVNGLGTAASRSTIYLGEHF